jgi:hypothetical protein
MLNTYSFLEWVKQKEEVLDEVRRRTVARRAVMSEDGLKPHEGDFIVFDPVLFFNKAIAAAKDGKEIDPSEPDLNVGMMTQSQGTTGLVHKIGGDVLPEIYVIPDNFRDVTDAFNTVQLPEGRRILVYMGLRRYSGQQHKEAHAGARSLYNKWRALKSSIVDAGFVAVNNAILGPEAAKGVVIKQGKQERNKWFQARAKAAEAGEDVTTEFKDELSEDEGLVQHLRRIGAGAIVDQLHDNGLPVAGEPTKPEQELSPFEKMFEPSKQGEPAKVQTPAPQAAPQAAQFEPGSRIISTNPQQLAALGQARQGIQRTPEQEKAKQKFNSLFGNLDVAHYDPTLIGQHRRWKIHNDARFYPYFPITSA